ncbi:MAG: hypothetical protein BMS9Abin04_421 [Planctomycetia bacterium]|nr:MAG: hypothetical protein BMS9Abin04_421 [Planctomycetia bacterium]
MRKLVSALILFSLIAGTATAQPWYARGDYNGWDISEQMVDQGGGHYTKTINGLTAGTGYEYKIADENWTANAPGSNGKVPADANGEINYHFWEADSWADGWEPSAKMRVGYNDHGLFDWEVIGAMNGWSGGASWYLTDQGSGLHTRQFVLDAGTYEWKFRQQDDWAYAIGDDFGNSAANNSITVASDGDLWEFTLDLPNGRWQAVFIPEPATLGLFCLGGIALVLLRRRLRA